MGFGASRASCRAALRPDSGSRQYDMRNASATPRSVPSTTAPRRAAIWRSSSRVGNVVDHIQDPPLPGEGLERIAQLPGDDPAALSERRQVWLIRLEEPEDRVMLGLQPIVGHIGVHPEEAARILVRTVSVQVF